MEANARLLRSFVVVAEELHLGRAARRLYLSQPSLSQQMRKLEGMVGAELLERHPKGVRLTGAGDVLLAAVRAPLEALDAAMEAAAYAGRGGRRTTLPVGFVGSAANELTTPILVEFARRSPDTEVRLRRFDISDPTAGLLDRSARVAFVRDLRGHAQLEAEPLLTEPRVWVLPAGHRLAGRSAIADADVRDEPGISFERALDPATRGTWRERYHHPLPADRRGRAQHRRLARARRRRATHHHRARLDRALLRPARPRVRPRPGRAAFDRLGRVAPRGGRRTRDDVRAGRPRDGRGTAGASDLGGRGRADVSRPRSRVMACRRREWLPVSTAGSAER